MEGSLLGAIPKKKPGQPSVRSLHQLLLRLLKEDINLGSKVCQLCVSCGGVWERGRLVMLMMLRDFQVDEADMDVWNSMRVNL